MPIKQSKETIVDDDTCWVCGSTFDRECRKTMHHTLPKHLKPTKNVVIPICATCHDKVTADDPQALLNFGYKMMKTTIEQTQQITELVKLAKMRVEEQN